MLMTEDMYFIVEKTLGKLRRLFSRKRCEEKETLKRVMQNQDFLRLRLVFSLCSEKKFLF